MEDNTLDAIERVKEIINSKKIKTESKDNELQNLRDKIWEYLIDDYHRLEDFTDIEMTEETNEEIYDTAEENLAKFSIEELETMLKEIESGNIDLVAWGHKALSSDLKESKEITLDDVLNELGIMKDSPAEQEESSKIKEFMEIHPEASLDQIVKAYKNYEETGLFECKEIKAEEEFPVKELNESNK